MHAIGESCINERCVRRREKGKKEKKRKERKREKKRERKGEKEIDVFFLRSPVFRRSELIEPRSKVRIINEGYALRGRNSSYFCLFLSFRLLFWVDFGTMSCHVYGMGRVCSWFKSYFRGKFGLKHCV